MISDASFASLENFDPIAKNLATLNKSCGGISWTKKAVKQPLLGDVLTKKLHSDAVGFYLLNLFRQSNAFHLLVRSERCLVTVLPIS